MIPTLLAPTERNNTISNDKVDIIATVGYLCRQTERNKHGGLIIGLHACICVLYQYMFVRLGWLTDRRRGYNNKGKVGHVWTGQ